MTDQIFISYRRDDAAYVTGHINDLLRKEFGHDAVFTDIDNIALGVDFRAVLDQTVSQCQVLLAVIGVDWLTVRDQEGGLRLQDPADFVRIEIESALKRDIPVIPLLVSGAKMPAAEELPESLRGLAFRNGTQIRPAQDFIVDMARLIKNLRRHFDAIRTGAGDEPGIKVTTEPTRDAAPIEQRSPADVGEQRDSSSKQSDTSGFRVQVGEEESARKQAELSIGHREPKSRWAKRIWGIAGVVLVAAAWFYADRNPETVQGALTAAQTAIIESEQNLDVSDDAETNLTDDTEIGPPTSFSAAASVDPVENPAADLDVNSTTGNDAEAVLEPKPETAAKLRNDATNETAEDTEAVLEPVPVTETDTFENLTASDTSETAADAVATPEAEAAGEASDQPDAVDEVVDDAEASLTASDDTAPVADVDGEFVLSPGSQRQADASQLIGEGIRLAGVGDHETAIQIFDEAIQLDVEPAFVYKQRGASFQALGQYEAAIQDYDYAVQVNREDLITLYNRGVSHYALQNYESAIADFDTVIQLDPEFVDAYSRRAGAHEAMGNAEAATRDRAVVTAFESNRDNPR